MKTNVNHTLLLSAVVSTLALCLITCTPRQLVVQRYLAPEARPVAFEQSGRRSASPCDDPSNYIPDSLHLDHFPVKELRVNIHWMNSADSSRNLDGKRAVAFAKGLIRAANQDVGRNHALFLPNGNDIPVLPVGYRYVLTGRPDDPDDDGIYFHYDDELYHYIVRGRNRNLTDRRQMQTYGVQKDTVLNFFIMPHHPDSVASPTYDSWGVGIALTNHIKMAADWLGEDRNDYWNHRGNFNHETGHILSLRHAWTRDGCDDTPQHKQVCWGRGDRPGCDTLTSNNVMDYNAKQHAWSPCQIGRLRQRLTKLDGRVRKMLIPNWCTRDSAQDLTITDTVEWSSPRDLEGDLRIDPGGQLTVHCRLSIPEAGRITVAPGGRLVLERALVHNACGREWDGIFIESSGTVQGQVTWNEARLENTPLPDVRE